MLTKKMETQGWFCTCIMLCIWERNANKMVPCKLKSIYFWKNRTCLFLHVISYINFTNITFNRSSAWCALRRSIVYDTPALLHCTCHFVYKDACFLYNQLCNAHRYRRIKLHVCQKCIPQNNPVKVTILWIFTNILFSNR